VVWFAALLAAIAAGGGGARADARLGVGVCELFRGVPGEGHPLRKKGSFAGAFRALEQAGRDPRRAAAALRRFERARAAALTAAAKAFRTEADGETGFDTARAARFLSAEVLVPNGAVRVGRDGFEVSPAAMAGLALAACRAGEVEAVLRAARQVTGADTATLKASAVLVALFSDGDHGAPEALFDLTRDLEADHFTAAFALAELAARGGSKDEARSLHARARALVTTTDEGEAWRRQEGRL
jgi:hypothetical protein